MQPPDHLRAAKAAARQAAKARRRGASAAAGPDAAERALAHLRPVLPRVAARCVVGYWPMGDEFDVRPMLSWFEQTGWTCGLPGLVGRDRPLEFRRWRRGDVLVPARLGTSEPGAESPVVEPFVLLVPLLAFDHEGYRLGYGGGYYDRTLAALRGRREVVAIGVAYAGQEVDHVPHDETDQRLDWVITEQGAIRIERHVASEAAR